MYQWMDAYWSGMEAHDAQLHVCSLRSKKYKSHHFFPEQVPQLFDQLILWMFDYPVILDTQF